VDQFRAHRLSESAFRRILGAELAHLTFVSSAGEDQEPFADQGRTSAAGAPSAGRRHPAYAAAEELALELGRVVLVQVGIGCPRQLRRV
jgi:hypothetical protein